ncbi:YkvA family protein [Neolewinella litorea]|uniref:DUF1232 domain-containing protein n=1 Tax=Neolewinella litorea TaxID=2562452 RepID=A0A4S4NPI8_9BACT|nr:YkvA family protein [Neolewinella litorea]THH41959.1 DUF1232 domain-containing protein [Neolewinella litorea]
MNLQPYRRFFSRNRFWARLGGLARATGTKSIYTALLLYYAYERKETPKWAKRVVLGALGYLLMPLDAIPDLTPILGYTDDVSVLAAGLATVAAYVNEEVRDRAKDKLAEWFPEARTEDVREIDERL